MENIEDLNHDDFRIQLSIGSTTNSTAPSLVQKSFAQNTPFSDISSEGGDQQDYTYKLENFKIALNQLRKELHAEKIKNQAFSTVIESTKETKEENLKLRRELQIKESGIAVLQNRLGQLGEDTSVKLQHGDVLIPGPSRQLLDSLTEENVRLKDSLRYINVDPTQFAHLQKRNQILEKKLDETRTQLQSRENENDHLRKLLDSSENLKDNEISKLKNEVLGLQRNKDTQIVLCQSLSDETESLRDKLKGMAEQCQKLERKLECFEKSSGIQAFEKQSLVQNSTDIDNKQIREVLEKKNKEMIEIVEMNSRWQKYNSQREEYVQKLHRSVRDLEEKLCQSRSEPQGISEDQQADIDRLILTCKRKVETVEEEKQKVEDESCLVRLKLHQTEEHLRTKNSDIETLKQHVQALSNQENSVTDRERIQILEHQIKICTDDFQQERNDREKAMARITMLENELEFHQRQLQQFQTRSMNQIAERRNQALHNYQQQYNQHYPHAQQDFNAGGMVARGPIMYEADGDDSSGEDVIDGVPEVLRFARDDVPQTVTQINQVANVNQRAHSESGFQPQRYINKPAVSSIISSAKTAPVNLFSSPLSYETDEVVSEKQDILQCPKCHLGFSADKHFELLDHINDCV